MTVVLVAGNTATAEIDGISAAGSDPDATAHTPAADLEVVTYGRPVTAPSVPVSPEGCPSPAVVTRAARELLGFETIPVNAGLAASTGAPTVDFGAEPGNDVRDRLAVPDARETLETARRFGRALPDDELAIGETVPGGTTTAMAVLAALGERATVSSSLPENPLSLKRAVVRDALAASELERGATAGEPVETLRCVGDPVLTAATGLALGATDAGTAVTLAGGTQMAAVAALVRHAGVDAPLALETTSFVAADETASLEEVAADLAVETTVTDPGFDRRDHPATNAYVAGLAKEGVGMGAALALLERSEVPMGALRDRVCDLADELLAETPPNDS